MRSLRVPAPLLALLALTAVELVVWALVLPALQGPDEVRHFGHVQNVVEQGTLSFRPNHHGSAEWYSSQVRTAWLWAGLEPLRGNPAARPLWTAADEAAWRAHDRGAAGRRDDGGFNGTERYPPLYYLYAAVPYEVASGGSLFDRVTLMRLANLPFVLAFVLCAWLLAGELLGAAVWPRALAGAIAALQPQLMNVGAIVAPDTLLAAEWAAAFVVMARLLRRGPTRRRLAALAGLCAAALATHPRGLPLLAPAVLAIAVSWLRFRPARSRPSAAAVYSGLGVAGASAVAGALVYATGGHPSPSALRQLGSYLWQFYLPRLPGMTPAKLSGYGFDDVYVLRFWDWLVQFEVRFPRNVNQLLTALTLAFLVALVVAAWARRAQLTRRWDLALVLAVAVMAPILMLHLQGYRTLSSSVDPVITGRYLLPLVPLLGCAVAFVAGTLPRRGAAALGGAALGGAILLQLGALGIVVERFYA